MAKQGTIPSPFGVIRYKRDAWGYPQFHVRNHRQGDWARGWFHAVDRQLQIELSRHAAEGRLMEVLGDEPFTRTIDRGVRTLGLARGLDEQVEKLDAATRELCDAYCDGFAAGAASVGRPLVWRLLGIEQRPWTPRDILLVYRLITWFGLNSLTQTGRVGVAQLIADGADEAGLRKILGPGGEGLDLAGCAGLTLGEAFRQGGIPVQRGSNAFAVSAGRSASGSPLLMSEFHMEVARFPPVAHISMTQLDDGRYLQGVSIPGLPLVSAGRTESLAWGYTFGHADNVDITVQRCRAGERLVGDTWVPLASHEETVGIRGGKAETWTVWKFGHGVVLGDPTGSQERPIVGMEWRGMEDVANALVHSALPILEHGSVERAIEAHRHLTNCSLAGVFADREHIGWIQTGRVALHRAGWGPRPGWDLGDDPDIPEADRPMKLDPPEGFVASANEACPGWTSFAEPRYRHERLRELLGGTDLLTADDLLRISYDEYDGCAARLMAVWGELLPAEAAPMAEWAASQSPKLSASGRGHMARFHALHTELSARYIASSVGMELHSRASDTLFDFVLQDSIDDVLALEHPEHLDREGLARLLADAWPVAAAAPTDRVAGPVRARFANLVTQGKLPAWVGMSSPPVDLPGGPTSLLASRRSVFGGHDVITGPAFHILVDMAEPGLRYNICGGASERRFGPGYGAGLDAYLTGELLPLRPSTAPAAEDQPTREGGGAENRA